MAKRIRELRARDRGGIASPSRTLRDRRHVGATFAALAFLGAALAFESSAAAFCRSSTCRTTATRECETDEDECPISGAKLFWPTSCISYATNRLGTQDLDPVDTREIIKKTFQAWSDVECAGGGVASMTFQEREPVACKRSEYNKTGANVNVVLFQDDDWKYRGIDGTLAKTSVTYNDETGEIYDADIEINTANNTVTISDIPAKVQYDLQAIVTHEVGHFIGIAHSPDSSAVMFASYSPGSTTQRTLSADDVDAVCGVYPPKSGVVCNTEPRGGFSAECPEDEPKDGICAVSTAGVNTGTGAIAIGLGMVALSALRNHRRGRARARRRDLGRDLDRVDDAEASKLEGVVR